MVTFVLTWLPSMLMEIIRYHHKAKPEGNNSSLICDLDDAKYNYEIHFLMSLMDKSNSCPHVISL